MCSLGIAVAGAEVCFWLIPLLSSGTIDHFPHPSFLLLLPLLLLPFVSLTLLLPPQLPERDKRLTPRRSGGARVRRRRRRRRSGGDSGVMSS